MLGFGWNLFTILLVVLNTLTHAFNDYLLNGCDKSPICIRNRFYRDNILDTITNDKKRKNWQYHYSIAESSLKIDENILYGTIVKTVNDDLKVNLPFQVNFLKDLNAVRFKIDEERTHCWDKETGQIEFYPNTIVNCQRYNQTWDWSVTEFYRTNYTSPHEDIFMQEGNTTLSDSRENKNNGWSFFAFNSHGDDTSNHKIVTIKNNLENIKIVIDLDTVKFQIFFNEELVITLNERNLFNWEQQRLPDHLNGTFLPQESDLNLFNSKFDSVTVPLGPESIGLDFTFHNFANVYGIPEHADSLRLKDTSGSDPYRLFNVDVFEYNVDSTQPMYGAIPLMIAQRRNLSLGLLWINAADTWIDINYTDSNTKTHWFSENGVMDMVIFMDQSPRGVTNQYVTLTGKPVLPLLSTIGYHQCRWNYNNELDLLNVQDMMDLNHIPLDVVWLDLDYTDEKKFFTWKFDSFPNPKRLLQKLSKFGRQLVVLIDPHLMSQYEISAEVIAANSQVKDKSGNTFIGDCWPGKSIWIDTIGKIGQKTWYKLFTKFVHESSGSNNLHFWNDMNEPSVFSGPETTAPKDVIHDGNFEERSIHNLYGLSVHETTYNAMKKIYEKLTRPFILTRSYFIGSQRSAATWTGDNVATWEYLKISIPMILTNNIVGMPFIGADIAGFSGNPDEELYIRWYQAGLWYPFFRGHAHIDTVRREPYLFDDPTRSIVRAAIRLRYKLLPTFYTAFYQASIDGTPVISPMFYIHPNQERFYDIDDQFYLGQFGIIVKPIVSANTFNTTMTLAQGIYYDLEDLSSKIIDTSVGEITVDAPISKIPAFIEGGHIIIQRERYRRSAKLMQNDPYQLIVATDKNGYSYGKLYIDDGESFEYENGQYLETIFSFMDGVLSNRPVNTFAEVSTTLIEKIVIPLNKYSQLDVGEYVTVNRNTAEEHIPVFKIDNQIVIKNPRVYANETWELRF